MSWTSKILAAIRNTVRPAKAEPAAAGAPVAGPRLAPEAQQILQRFGECYEPVSRGEMELYVPPNFRALEPDWIFTRAVILSRTAVGGSERVWSIGGFDVASEDGVVERYKVYRAVYGYLDRDQRLHTFPLEPFEVRSGYLHNDRLEMKTRPGDTFVMCFDQRSPGTHHRFIERFHDSKSDVAWLRSLK